MTYNFQSKAFTITEDSLRLAGMNGMYAIQCIRKSHGLPLGKYEHSPGSLSDADHAQKAVIDLLKAIGVDMGVFWGHELDVTKIG